MNNLFDLPDDILGVIFDKDIIGTYMRYVMLFVCKAASRIITSMDRVEQSFLCDAAAEHGHLYILQQLVGSNYPVDEDTCAAGARGRHLYIMKYLHWIGCPWDEKTLDYSGRHTAVYRYAIKRGCTRPRKYNQWC